MLRYAGDPPGRVLTSETKDAGLHWTQPTKTDLPNPGSAVALLNLGDGKLLLAERDSLALSPDGHGGTLAALVKNGCLDDAKRRPLSPLLDERYAWARIKGQTLTVHTLVIREDGGYDMQVYNRTLTALGMELEFVAFRDGEERRNASGRLVKVGN